MVLVNQSSASSSEIVAGSLQAHDRAELVGTGTFGKGSIQVDYVLRDGSALRLTVQRWYLPNGHSVNGQASLRTARLSYTNRTRCSTLSNPHVASRATPSWS